MISNLSNSESHLWVYANVCWLKRVTFTIYTRKTFFFMQQEVYSWPKLKMTECSYWDRHFYEVMKCQNEPCYPQGTGRWKAHSFLEMRPHIKAWGASIQSCVNAPFVNARDIASATSVQFTVIPRFLMLIFVHTSKAGSPPPAHTVKSILPSASLTSSEMPVSGNHICCFLQNAYFRKSRNSLLPANYFWLHHTLCFRGQLPTKWG